MEGRSEDRVRMAHVSANGPLKAFIAPAARQGQGATRVSWIVRAQAMGGVRDTAYACAEEAIREPTALKESALQVRNRNGMVF